MQKKYESIEKYQKENIRRYVLKVNKNTDSDILEKFKSVKNINGYLKDLIRKDIEK